MEISAEDFLGHAVRAAEIAAIGHGYSQVAKGPAEAVCVGRVGKMAHVEYAVYCRVRKKNLRPARRRAARSAQNLPVPRPPLRYRGTSAHPLFRRRTR